MSSKHLYNLINDPLEEKNLANEFPDIVLEMENILQKILTNQINEKNEPNASYAPTYIDPQCNFYIYISTLAKHTKNLITNNKISFMVMEENSANVFAKKRITFKHLFTFDLF